MNRWQIVKEIVSKIENGAFVEIGTHTGEFARHILTCSPSSTLYCVDPYTSYDEYDDGINKSMSDEFFEKVSTELKAEFGDRVVFVRAFSADAVPLVPAEIDFLYVDGNHRYSYVLQDLKNYFPLLKNGGVVVGDDAVDHDDSKRNENGDIYIEWIPGVYGNYGVIKAFREFAETNHIYGSLQGNQYVLKKNK